MMQVYVQNKITGCISEYMYEYIYLWGENNIPVSCTAILRNLTFGENHAIEGSVKLDVHSHIGLLALNLQVFDLWHVWCR
jgi:hypothetical protein